MDSKDNSVYGLKVLLFVILLLFVPLFATCAWAVFNDPLTPHLFLELWFRVRDCCCGKGRKGKKKRGSEREGRGEGRRRRRVDEGTDGLDGWASSFQQPGFTSAPGDAVVTSAQDTRYATVTGGAGGPSEPFLHSK